MKLKVIKKVKVAVVVMCVYVCRWRRTLDFWDPGRVSHLDDSCENNRSQHGGDLSTSLISMWATFESQIIMFHLHGLTGSSSRVEQIVFVLTFTCNLETFEGVLIHPQTEETNTCTSGSVSVFLLGLPVAAFSLSSCSSEYLLIKMEASRLCSELSCLSCVLFGHFKRCWVLVELVERFPSVFLCSLCCMCPRLVNAHVKPTIGRLWADSALTPDLWGGSVPWRWILWVLASWECRGQVDADWGAWLVQNKV